MNQGSKGYVFGAVAAATYGLNPLFALPLYKAGMDPDSVLFFRYLFAIPIVGIMLKSRGHYFKLKLREIAALLVLGLLVAVSSLTLFEAYNYMDAGIASTILFVYPILVAILMTLVFKERLQWLTVACIVVALGGIALLYKNNEGATLSLVGIMLVMASALSYALYIAGINLPMMKNMATLKITFFSLLFGMILFFVRIDFGQSVVLPDKWYLWGNLLALAVFPTTISFLCTNIAIQCIGSTPTAILGALEPATAIFFGVTVFGEKLTLREGIGLLLIILAVTLVVAGKNISAYLIRFRKLFPKRNHGQLD